MPVDLEDPIMEGYIPLQDFIDQDGDQSSRIRDLPFGKKKEDIELSPDTLTFPNTGAEYESPSQAIVITNVGWDTVNIYSHTLDGDFILKSAVPESLMAGESATINVAFKPLTPGSKTGSLYFDTGNAAGDEQVDLSGVGILSSPEVTPDELVEFIQDTVDEYLGDEYAKTDDVTAALLNKQDAHENLDNLSARSLGDAGLDVLSAVTPEAVHTQLAMDWSHGTPNAPILSVPEVMIRNWIDLQSYMGTDDTQDFWPTLKALLENSSSERDAILAGARVFLSSRRAWQFKSRAAGYITLPQFFHMEMAPNALIDASGLPVSSAPSLFTYGGKLGLPTRPVVANYLSGTSTITFSGGVVASRGWKRGDVLTVRATEGLDDMNVGAFELENVYKTDTPATFSFFVAAANYVIGDGVISVDDGKSYRCKEDHIAGSTIDLTKFTITGLNAISEDVTIHTVVGDTIYLTARLRYNYPTAARPLFCKKENTGHHIFENFSFVGNHPDGILDTGIWITDANYQVGQMAYAAGPNAVRHFRCLIPHTSGVFLDDLDNGVWEDMGSDRLFRISVSDTAIFEGGRIERVSGMPFGLISITDMVMRDHHGFGTNKLNAPGGYLYVGGSYNKALIENVTIEGASQPFMVSATGNEYGVGYGMTMRDCLAKGGSSAFTQHWMEDATVWDNCRHEDSIPSVSGGVSFDIRTPTTMINCKSLNSRNGRAVALRNNFMGRNQDDTGERGTVITKCVFDDCLSGIVLDDTNLINDKGWPSTEGYLEISDNQFTRIGGTNSSGAIVLVWPNLDGAAYPILGRLKLTENRISVKSDFHVVKIGGLWNRPEIGENFIEAAQGFTPAGTWRSYWIYDGGAPSLENRPILPIFRDTNTQNAGFAAPLISALDLRNYDGYRTIGSNRPITPGQGSTTNTWAEIAAGSFASITVSTDAALTAAVTDRVHVWGNVSAGIQLIAAAGAGSVTIWARNFSASPITMGSRTIYYEIIKNP